MCLKSKRIPLAVTISRKLKVIGQPIFLVLKRRKIFFFLNKVLNLKEIAVTN